MQLEERITLRLVQDRIIRKINSFDTWPEFINWIKGITQAKFKTFIIQCVDDVMAMNLDENTDLTEAKTSLET